MESAENVLSCTNQTARLPFKRLCFFFLSSGFSFTDTDNNRGREETIFYSTLPLPPAHEYSDIYFATLHVKWLSHIFSRNACICQAVTRWGLPSYRITIWLIDDVMLIFVCLLVDLIFRFCYSYLTWETGGLKLALTINLVLLANRLTKCANHPYMCPKCAINTYIDLSFQVSNISNFLRIGGNS